jgi:hypothetical protein
MPDYSQAKIYKIIGGEECYIGSTAEKYLSNRMGGHRTSYKLWKNGKKNFITSFTLFDKYGVENCRIELIEMFACACVEELRKQEGEWIKKNECINKRIEGRTQKQYKEEHKEEIQLYKQQYVEEHKEEIQQYQRQYAEEHKEELQQYRQQYYEEKKEEILERMSVKYTCECGTTLRLCNKSRHNRTKKHLTFLQK